MATKIFMEALSPTMEEGRVVKWNKNEGDAVTSGDSLAEVETDKAIMELVARGDGVLRKRLVAEGESRPVGTLLGVIGTADENIDAVVGSAVASGGGAAAPAAAANATVAQTKEKPAASPIPQQPQQSQGEASTPPQEKEPAGAPQASGSGNGRQSAPQHDGPVRSSPLARRMARERGVELSGVAGSGPG